MADLEKHLNGQYVRAQDGELLEELIMRQYGRQSEALVNLVRDDHRNRSLIQPSRSIVLSMDIEVWCPEVPQSEAQRVQPHSDNLWD